MCAFSQWSDRPNICATEKLLVECVEATMGSNGFARVVVDYWIQWVTLTFAFYKRTHMLRSERCPSECSHPTPGRWGCVGSYIS